MERPIPPLRRRSVAVALAALALGGCLVEFPAYRAPRPCKMQADCEEGELCRAQPGGRLICETLDAGEEGAGGAPGPGSDPLLPAACPDLAGMKRCESSNTSICPYAPATGTLAADVDCREVCKRAGMPCLGALDHGAEPCAGRGSPGECGPPGARAICLCAN